MGLAFVNHLFLWLLPAAAAPLLFHLFFRMRKRPRVFSTLLFFQQIDPALSARRKIRQWLLLLLRSLLVATVLLALARPSLRGIGAGSTRAAVMLIDNSSSMCRTDRAGAGAPMDTAISAARACLSSLGVHDAAAIVLLVQDPTVALPTGLSTDKDQLRAALDRIVPTEAAGEPARAFRQAFSLLEDHPAARAEIHVFTDLQDSDWGATAGQLPLPRAGTSIVIHRIEPPSDRGANAALVNVELPRRRLLAGRPLPVRLSLANNSDADAAIRVNWSDSSGTRNAKDVAVPRQSELRVDVTITPRATGLDCLMVWIEGDSFAGDNRAGIVFICEDLVLVQFAGQPQEFGLLPLALAPPGDHALSGIVPFFSMRVQTTNPLPALIVTPWTRAAQFKSCLDAGANLLIVPPVAASTPAWLGATCQPIETNAAGTPLFVFSKSAPLLADLRDERGDVMLRAVKAFKYYPLAPLAGSERLLGLEDGRPVLTACSYGNGTIFASGIAFDTDASTLPLKSSFIPLVQCMPLYRTGIASRVQSRVAGTRIESLPAATRDVRIVSLIGSSLDWRGSMESIPVVPRAGVYMLTAGSFTNWIAVRSADREGSARVLSTGVVPCLADLPHVVKPYTDANVLVASLDAMRRGSELYMPLVVLAVLILLLETWVANPLPRTTVQADNKPGLFRMLTSLRKERTR